MKRSGDLMKWYKHISDSLDDPFIFDLMSKHGSDGYLVFFGVLEIYSREFKPDLSWNLSVSLSYLKQKFHKTHKQLITNPLQTISNSGKWDVVINGDQVTIFIPKFTELLDEWTARKIGSKSGVTPEILKRNIDTDKELDKDLDKEKLKEKVTRLPDKPKAETTDPEKQPVFEKLKELMIKFPDQRYQHNIQEFVKANWFKNDKAIEHCLNQLLISKKTVPYPRKFLEKILSVENGNFNEREFQQGHQKNKEPISIAGIPGLGDVLKTMAGSNQ